MIVVSDTSPLNYLLQICLVDVLPRLYGQIYIPHEVHEELLASGASAKLQQWAMHPPAWLQVQSALLDILALEGLDSGERAAINLAVEIHAGQMLVDDGQARRILLQKFNLSVKGTLGVLLEGHLAGYLNAYEAFGLLRRNTNFYCTPQVEKAFLAYLTELS
jgi:predicted nucleic acid-binding protein